MPPTDSPDPRAPGARVRAARRARVRTIRRRVMGGAVVLFVAVWMLIAVTLISGHDPALAKRSTSSKASGGSGTTAPLPSSGSSTSGGDTGSSSSSGTASSSSGLGSVTTSQS
jgi:hypothetical protein